VTTASAPKEKDLMKAFEQADKDGSGVVDLKEFVALYSKVTTRTTRMRRLRRRMRRLRRRRRRR
jgi:Ca2+-binding EF-hand superfamily protein